MQYNRQRANHTDASLKLSSSRARQSKMLYNWVLKFVDSAGNAGRLMAIARSADDARALLKEKWTSWRINEQLLTSDATALKSWDSIKSVDVCIDVRKDEWKTVSTMEEAIAEGWLECAGSNAVYLSVGYSD